MEDVKLIERILDLSYEKKIISSWKLLFKRWNN